LAEYYETSREHEMGDGRLEVELPAGRLEWLERLLLRLWPDAEVVDPPDLARTRPRARRPDPATVRIG
jgi:predicted DNA-binding transcriptional regulator YafY